jgi:hypothetical protein
VAGTTGIALTTLRHVSWQLLGAPRLQPTTGVPALAGESGQTIHALRCKHGMMCSPQGQPMRTMPSSPQPRQTQTQPQTQSTAGGTVTSNGDATAQHTASSWCTKTQAHWVAYTGQDAASNSQHPAYLQHIPVDCRGSLQTPTRHQPQQKRFLVHDTITSLVTGNPIAYVTAEHLVPALPHAPML